MQQYDWSTLYKNAVLEANTSQLRPQIESLEAALQNRIVDLRHTPDAVEYKDASDAIEAVRVLKAERLLT